MIRKKKKIVLYQPAQVDESLGLPSSKDMLPLEMLTIAAYPLQDGYEVQVVDGSLYLPDEAHARLVEACADSFLYGTTGILGYMVKDGYYATQKVHERYPDLKKVIGGWFASVKPELHLATGLYDAVVLGQGELTFRELVKAIDAGEPLDDIAGLALWRDGQVVKTPKRAVVGWDQLLNAAWHLIDIEPYKAQQLREYSCHHILRMPTPPAFGSTREPYFGITYFSSYGCPEPCTFCCSPFVTDRRWKAMPAERMLDDLQELHDRWKFDVVRFHDANFGVMQKRVKEFTEGKLARELPFYWNAFIETHSILSYKKDVLDNMAKSGMYIAEIGAESGDDGQMKEIGKPIKGDDNIAATVEMDKRGICGSVTYIIGYPNETQEQMMTTIDQCRRLHVAAPLARPTVWPYRPIPGTDMFQQAVDLGYKPPVELADWGSIGEYHLEETWPGKIPPEVANARKMYSHYVSLDYGLVRGRRGFWEKRAAKRLRENTYFSVPAKLEAKVFTLYDRCERAVTGRQMISRSWVDPGHKTGTEGNEYSRSRESMTATTAGS